MLILAVDTTGDNGGIGIFRDGECLAAIPSPGAANQFSTSLFEMVEAGLASAKLTLRDVELYAAANGPGSFTGIRVGLAAARAWGRAFDRPVRGVSVLEAMVHDARLRAQAPGSGTTNWYFPIVDARRGEFYVGSFREAISVRSGTVNATSEAESANDYEAADEGWVLKPEALHACLEARLGSPSTGACIVRAHDHAAIEFAATLPAIMKTYQVEGTLLGPIAAIALQDARCGRDDPSGKLDAYYIRRPDAEVKRIHD